MKLEISPEDRELLVQLLEEAIGDTRVEVRRSRNPGFRDPLVAAEERLKALLEELRKLAPGD